MTPEERRRLLGDAAIAESRRIAETAVWPPELVADLMVLLRRPARSSFDTADDDAA